MRRRFAPTTAALLLFTALAGWIGLRMVFGSFWTPKSTPEAPKTTRRAQKSTPEAEKSTPEAPKSTPEVQKSIPGAASIRSGIDLGRLGSILGRSGLPKGSPKCPGVVFGSVFDDFGGRKRRQNLQKSFRKGVRERKR